MSTSFRDPFLGIGTGRCGTTSLAKLVNACRNTRVSHEAYQMHWYEVNKRVGDLIRDMREQAKKGVLFGEVSLGVGPHVGHIRASMPYAKVICLHRDKEDTVRSFVEFGSYCLRPKDKIAWADRVSKDPTGVMANAHKAFPIVDGMNVEQAYGFYWEMYEELMSAVRDPVLHVRIKQLNDDHYLNQIFDFLEIPEDDRVYKEERKHFSIEEVTRRVSEPRTREQERERERILANDRAGA